MHRIIKTCLLFLFWGTRLHAAEVLERHIDVRFQQTPLKDALATVAQKAGFEWSYNTHIVDGTKKVSLIANDWTVRETLYELLGDGYEFKNNGNYLILKKRKKRAEELSGYIKDRATGQRVANATIYDRRTLRATTTDSNGYYELRVKKSTEITIARLHYRDTIFPVTSSSVRFQKFDLQVKAPDQVHILTLQENLQRVTTQAELFFRVSLNTWTALNVPDSLHRRFQLSLLPKIGTNHVLSGKVVNDWSVNLLAGTSQGNRKVELGGMANFTRKNMTGLQAAGIFNELHGNATGVQLAGIYNHAGDTLQGLQAAGIINVTQQAVGLSVQMSVIMNRAQQLRGIQATGIYNSVRDTLRGLQLSGMINEAQNVEGSTGQISGLLNRASQGTLLLQAAGIANRAEQINGLQAAGVMNTADTIQGVQVATFSNRARQVKGLQFGLINSTQELHGLQIGLINRSGRRVLPLINWGFFSKNKLK